MKYKVTRPGDPTEAIGAYSGYRVRLVAGVDAATATYTPAVFFRGSESMPEMPVPMGEAGFESAAQALEAGYRRAVEWIDRVDAIATSALGGDEPDPGTGHNG